MHAAILVLLPVFDSVHMKPVINQLEQVHHITVSHHSDSPAKLWEATELNFLFTKSHVTFRSVGSWKVPTNVIPVITSVTYDLADNSYQFHVNLRRHMIVMTGRTVSQKPTHHRL